MACKIIIPMRYSEINQAFANRHSVRRYTGEEIPSEKIKEMLTVAMYAPTTGNMQLATVIDTRSAEGKERLSPCHFAQPMVKACSDVLTFCADVRRFEQWCVASNAKPEFRNLQMFMAAVMDALAFAQQFVAIAELNGYGTCYLGTTLYNAPEIAEILALPDGVVPVITVTVGVPEGEPVETGRLPLEAILFDEKYIDRTPEEVKELYNEKELREDSHRFVVENSKSNLAQVFADIRYPGKNNVPFSEKLEAYLKRQGFLF